MRFLQENVGFVGGQIQFSFELLRVQNRLTVKHLQIWNNSDDKCAVVSEFGAWIAHEISISDQLVNFQFTTAN